MPETVAPETLTPARTWTAGFRVRTYEVGPAARLRLPDLCLWLQEISSYHADALGYGAEDLWAEGQAWVLRRLSVAVERAPEWGERLELETWPSVVGGLIAGRDYLLRDSEGAVTARATSEWFIIDLERRRPARMPQGVQGFALPDRPRALDPAPAPKAAPEAMAHERRIRVRRADLDLNRHANNARYVEWALEAAPDALDAEHTACGVDVTFHAEAVYDDTVVSACAEPEATGDGFAVGHRLTRESDGEVLAQARTRWRA